jgi:hypothetical protein
MLNKKGVFLTFMIFLLISSALALNVMMQRTGVKEEENFIQESAFREVNDRFNSIYSQIVSQREGYAGTVQNRIIPKAGEYIAGGNSVEVTQQVPPETIDTTQSDTIDALNLFTIFNASQKISPGFKIDGNVTAAFNMGAWGGTGGNNPEFGFLIQPYCLRYLPLELETGERDRFMGYQIPGENYAEAMSEDDDSPEPLCTQKSATDEHCFYWGCNLPFSITNIKAINIDFTVGDTYPGCAEYVTGTATCGGNNTFKTGSDCTQSCGTTGDNQCVTVHFYEEKFLGLGCTPNCPGKIIDGQTVAGNLDLAKNENDIKLSITGGGDLTLHFLSGGDPANPPGSGKMFLMYYNGKDTCMVNTAKINIVFDGPVGTIQYAGYEFGVRKPGFDYCRRTEGINCPN